MKSNIKVTYTQPYSLYLHHQVVERGRQLPIRSRLRLTDCGGCGDQGVGRPAVALNLLLTLLLALTTLPHRQMLPNEARVLAQLLNHRHRWLRHVCVRGVDCGDSKHLPWGFGGLWGRVVL